MIHTFQNPLIWHLLKQEAPGGDFQGLVLQKGCNKNGGKYNNEKQPVNNIKTN
jgi:hypothetical protein